MDGERELVTEELIAHIGALENIQRSLIRGRGYILPKELKYMKSITKHANKYTKMKL